MFDTPIDRMNDSAAAERRDTADVEANEDFDSADAISQGGVPSSSRAKRFRLWTGLLIALSVIAAWWFFAGPTPAPAAPPMAVVTTAQPLERSITEWDEFIGRFAASSSVEVRPQVSGQITRVHFTDGQIVRRGAPLFTIDSRTYRAAFDEAQAEVAAARSALGLSRGDLARAQRLVAEDAVAANEIDRLEAEVRNTEARLAAARARLASRSLDVEFATVRAPISGRISDRRVDAGNLVSGGGGSVATLLTTIDAVDPVHFEFAGSEALFLKARREGLDKGTAVEIKLQDEADYSRRGTLDFTDNRIDGDSGTIRARAVVPNPDGFLASGLFGRMRLATGGTRNALLVPDAAVTTDQTRKLLLVVGRDGNVAARAVELGPLIGSLRVIEKGLRASDRVVIEGVQMAMPGHKVRARSGRIAMARRPSGAPPTAPIATRAASATLAD
jgi:multidrug efflux system membrane fusion protein